MPKNTSSKDKQAPARPVKLFNPSSTSSLENSQPMDKDSKSSTPPELSQEESKQSYNKLLQEPSETPSTENDPSDPFSDQTDLFQLDQSTQDKSETDQDSSDQSKPEADQSKSDRSKSEEPEEEGDLVQLPDDNQEMYHLLMVPPEGSVVSESYETPQEILGAVVRHSQIPLVTGEIDSWGIHVFFGRKVELLGDIRTGRIALREGEETTELGGGSELAKTRPGTFQTVEDIVSSTAIEPASPDGPGFNLFDDNDRLF